MTRATLRNWLPKSIEMTPDDHPTTHRRQMVGKREGVSHAEPLNRPVFIATHSDEAFAPLLAGSGLNG